MEFSGVLNCLHNPKREDLREEIGSKLPIPNKTVNQKYAKAIIERLNSVDNEILEDTEIMLTEFPTQRHSDDRTYKEKSEEEIQKSMVSEEHKTQKQID